MDASFCDYSRRYADLFVSSPEQALRCSVLQANPIKPCRGQELHNQLLALPSTDSMVIVIFDSGQLSRIGKVHSLLLRPLTLSAAEKAIRVAGWKKICQWVLFPSSLRTSMIYQRNTAAARYAQTMLLPPQSSMILRWAHAAIASTAFGHPDIELIAITAER